MPSKYVVRNFTEDSYYHVFNRGVEKRDIFLDDEDYTTLQSYLFKYLQPIEKVAEKYPDTPTRLYGKNLSEEVELVAYCLMPNHFHLLLKQNTKDGISKLLKQLTNAYTLYFNQKNSKTKLSCIHCKISTRMSLLSRLMEKFFPKIFLISHSKEL